MFGHIAWNPTLLFLTQCSYKIRIHECTAENAKRWRGAGTLTDVHWKKTGVGEVHSPSFLDMTVGNFADIFLTFKVRSPTIPASIHQNQLVVPARA